MTILINDQFLSFLRKSQQGVVAQLVERSLCMREAAGSKPASSIFCYFYFNKQNTDSLLLPMEGLFKQFNGNLHDVEFSVQGNAFRAHKIILSSRSSYFKKLFEVSLYLVHDLYNHLQAR